MVPLGHREANDMPRSKMVKPEEAQAKLAASLQKLVDTTRDPKARKFLEETVEQLARAWLLLQFILNVRKMKPRPTKQQLEELFRIDKKKLATNTDCHGMTADDLTLYQSAIDYYTLLLTGRQAETELTPKALAQFLRRQGTRKIKPRKFKPEFVNAFKERQKALREGRGIAVPGLAARFTPAAFERNEASALRNMGQALQRIERDHMRLKAAGVESPYDK
jgi:hypothetical protein